MSGIGCQTPASSPDPPRSPGFHPPISDGCRVSDVGCQTAVPAALPGFSSPDIRRVSGVGCRVSDRRTRRAPRVFIPRYQTGVGCRVSDPRRLARSAALHRFSSPDIKYPAQAYEQYIITGFRGKPPGTMNTIRNQELGIRNAKALFLNRNSRSAFLRSRLAFPHTQACRTRRPAPLTPAFSPAFGNRTMYQTAPGLRLPSMRTAARTTQHKQSP